QRKPGEIDTGVEGTLQEAPELNVIVKFTSSGELVMLIEGEILPKIEDGGCPEYVAPENILVLPMLTWKSTVPAVTFRMSKPWKTGCTVPEPNRVSQCTFVNPESVPAPFGDCKKVKSTSPLDTPLIVTGRPPELRDHGSNVIAAKAGTGSSKK